MIPCHSNPCSYLLLIHKQVILFNVQNLNVFYIYFVLIMCFVVTVLSITHKRSCIRSLYQGNQGFGLNHCGCSEWGVGGQVCHNGNRSKRDQNKTHVASNFILAEWSEFRLLESIAITTKTSEIIHPPTTGSIYEGYCVYHVIMSCLLQSHPEPLHTLCGIKSEN